MDKEQVEALVADWDDVYKRGQLTLWVMLAISDGKKYAAQITEFMATATNGNFEVKEQSLYRALRRFSSMGIVKITEEQSPNSGPKRKYYELTAEGKAVLARFIQLHISPLMRPNITKILQRAEERGDKI